MKSLVSHFHGSSQVPGSTPAGVPSNQSAAVTRSMRHRGLMLFAMVFGLPPAALAWEEPLFVTVDQAFVTMVPAGTDTLIIGNASIADVTLLKSNNKLIVTGKSFGQTNFIALDAAKNILQQAQIYVVASKTALTVQLGLERQTYSCVPLCQPSAQLGDDPEYFNKVSKQAADHNTQAKGLP